MMKSFRDYLNLLNESFQFDVDEIVQFVKNEMDWSGGDGESIRQEFADANNLENINDVDDNSNGFNMWFEDWVRERALDVEDSIRKSISNGQIILYRCITAPIDWKPDPHMHPGIYWTWIERAADAHWGHDDESHVPWMMKATVPLSHVNWKVSIAMNVIPAYEEEKEIRLFDDTAIHIEKYWRKR